MNESRVTVTQSRITAVGNSNSDRPCPEISEAILTHFFLLYRFFRLLFSLHANVSESVVEPQAVTGRARM